MSEELKTKWQRHMEKKPRRSDESREKSISQRLKEIRTNPGTPSKWGKAPAAAPVQEPKAELPKSRGGVTQDAGFIERKKAYDASLGGGDSQPQQVIQPNSRFNALMSREEVNALYRAWAESRGFDLHTF